MATVQVSVSHMVQLKFLILNPVVSSPSCMLCLIILHLQHRFNCFLPGTQKQAAVSLLGGTSLQRTNVYVAANSYTQASDNTVTRLATYSVALSSYNAQYLHNKTRSLQRLAQEIVDQAALPHLGRIGLSFDPVYNVFNTLLACVSLSDSNAVACPYPTNLMHSFTLARQAFINEYNHLASFFMDVRNIAERYKILVVAAMQVVNRFYDSIQGAQGLVSYLSKSLGVGNICGKTNPNFCSFNPVSVRLLLYFLFQIMTVSKCLGDTSFSSRVLVCFVVFLPNSSCFHVSLLGNNNNNNTEYVVGIRCSVPHNALIRNNGQ